MHSFPGSRKLIYSGTMKNEDGNRFVDRWDRDDGPLGNGWRSTHDDHPRWWDLLELRGHLPVNIRPDHGPIVQPDNSGGRASAYRDFGAAFSDDFSIGVSWNGRHQAPGCPVACINLEDPDWGLAFCYEPEIEGGAYILWALGRQPNNIRVVQSAKGPSHADGAPMYFEMQVHKGAVRCLADDGEILTAAIPPALVGSTIHGVLVDVNPVPGRLADVEVIDGPFTISKL